MLGGGLAHDAAKWTSKPKVERIQTADPVKKDVLQELKITLWLSGEIRLAFEGTKRRSELRTSFLLAEVQPVVRLKRGVQLAGFSGILSILFAARQAPMGDDVDFQQYLQRHRFVGGLTWPQAGASGQDHLSGHCRGRKVAYTRHCNPLNHVGWVANTDEFKPHQVTGLFSKPDAGRKDQTSRRQEI